MALIDSIINAESGGNPDAKNPNSSASGVGQFINSTWIDTLSKHRPDLIEGKSPDEILALKSDPQLSRDMTAAYAADNAGILSKAGLPVTPGSTYLAHFAGPQGAIGLLSADPNTPAAAILGPKVVAANKFLTGMTAGDVANWAARKVGGAAPLAIAGPTSSPQPQAAPQPPQSQQPTQPAPQPQYGQSSPQPLPNFDAPMPPMMVPQRPRINLAQYYAQKAR